MQHNLVSPTPKHPNRDKFFKDIDNLTLSELNKKYADKKNNVAILNFHWENNNFGAVLTAYALNKFLNLSGYNAYNIDYKLKGACQKDYSNFIEFRNKYLPMTKQCNNKKDLESLNEYFSNFIVGSDQVFRYAFTKHQDGTYYLSFVNNENKKIAYAASFGHPEFEKNKQFTKITGMLLSRFNDISVREDSGIQICKNTFRLKAKHVLDPVFLLDVKYWEELASSSNSDAKIVHYLLSDNIDKEIEEELKCSKSIRWDKNTKIEEWLCSIKNADFVITDSFHGLCFCIIFNKQFVYIYKPFPALERIISLFKMFNIPECFMVEKNKNFKINECMKNKLDYSNINKLLDKYKEDSINFLINAIEKDNEKQFDNTYFYKKHIHKYLEIKYKLLYFINYCIYKLIFLKKQRDKIKFKALEYKTLYKSVSKL